LTPIACQAFESGDHVISRVRFVGDGTNECVVISGTANVTIEDSEIVHVATGIRIIGGGKVIVRRNRIHDFSWTGIRVGRASGSTLDYIGANLLIQGNDIYDSNTGCASYNVKDWNCRGPRGNGVSISRIKGASVIGNRITNTEFGCLRVVTKGEDTIVKDNYCEGPKYDAGFYFEFGWRGGLVTGNRLSGKSQNSRGMIFTNCDDDSHQAQIIENIVEGFKGPWQIGGCEIVAEKNVINCDDPSTAVLETGYFGLAINIARGKGTHTNAAKGNLIKNCEIGVAIGQGNASAGPTARVEDNMFTNVRTPITGYVFAFSALWGHAAHQPLIPGGHVIQNNRDAQTQQIVNAQ
jgi:Right handed beta helix region